jgi:translocator protein
MDTASSQQWYTLLEKPFFAPPSWLFGPVWSVLYVLIAVSFGYVFLQVIRGKWPSMTALPFFINLVANIAFTPLQFGLRSNALALADILVVLVTIPWMMRAVFRRAPWVAWVQVPYVLWVAFATVLQLSITWLNA